MSRHTIPFALLTFFAAVPPPVQARAEPGTLVENVELKTLSGSRERLLSPKAKANVFVFFRPNHERSLDALKQMAACQRELAGKPIHWVAVVSASEPAADVQAMVTESGIRMPVLLDEGDALYDRLGVRLHPMVGIADAKLRVVTMEPYRQIEYCEIIKSHLKVLLGEMTQAQLDHALNPDASALPGADLQKKAMRDVNMARKLLEIEQYEEAVKFAQKGLMVAPVHEAYTVLAQAYVKLRKCAEAERAIAQALKLDPGDSAAAALKGACR